jgi:hypothetical protein
LHADTPHLFETYNQLQAHYVNAYTPGVEAEDYVGQTALVHGSHRLKFTANHCAYQDEENGTSVRHRHTLW